MSLEEKLRKLNKKKVTKQELEILLGTAQDEALYKKIEQLVQNGWLSPIKTSSTNGNRRYPVFLRYRLTLPDLDFAAERAEIETLHPILQKDDLLWKKPDYYQKYQKQFKRLNHYLFQYGEARIPISRKERSFEIFGEEKQLEDKTFCRLLTALGLDQDTLYFYDTPEYCFNDFIPERKEKMILLICENKDIWFNIRRVMFEDRASELFGVKLDGIVYGCGNQIIQKNALKNYTRFMQCEQITYLYWGDIDRAGLNIYLNAVRSNPNLSIQLFFPAYEEMLRLAQKTELPDSADQRELVEDYSSIYAGISQENRPFIEESIAHNKRIPQEIIPYTYLKNTMR